MFLTALYFIPCCVSLLWAFSFLFKAKNQRQTIFMSMLIIDVFYYATTAVYLLPGTDYDLMVRMDALCVPIVFVQLPIMGLYIYLLQPKKKLHASQMLLLFPAAIFGTLVNLMYYILGFDNTAALIQSRDINGMLTGEFDTELYRLYVFIDDPLIEIFLFILAIVFIAYSIHALNKAGYKAGSVWRFIFKKAEINPAVLKILLTVSVVLILLPYGILGRKFMSDHVLFTSAMLIMLAVVKHLSGLLEYNAAESVITLHSITNTKTPQEESDEKLAANPGQSLSHNRSDILKAHFIEEMEAGAYKDEALSLQSMADRLGVSTRTLSSLVNNDFGAPFREILNRYRIEAAKKYMREHPDATQSAVAFQCGFKNDSVFNKKFKEAEGVTPLMWITRNSVEKSN